MKTCEKILLVDDEQRVLEGLRRTVQSECEVEIACGPQEGLKVMAQSGPFAVVVSDLRMPLMDGVQFLSRVKTISPDTIRVMLTGQADIHAAVASVNEGAIFRFLTKPCPPMIFRRTIAAALHQHQLVTAERNLLRKTLMGAVTTLTEILSVLHPATFGHSSRIKRYVMQMEEGFGSNDAWQFEVAATLSQVGCITLPAAICEKAFAGIELTESEQRIFDRHPSAAAEFLKRIPRLEYVAEMIAGQQLPFRDSDVDLAGMDGRLVLTGAQMLHAAIDLERLRRKRVPWESAIASMRERAGEYDPRLLDALEQGGDPFTDWITAPRNIAELEPSMIAEQDIIGRDGTLLARMGEELTLPSLERIRRLAEHTGVDEPVLMRVPAESAEMPMAGAGVPNIYHQSQTEPLWSSL